MHQIFLFGAIRPLPYFFAVTSVLGVLFTFVSPDSGRSAFGDLAFWLSQTLIPLSSILGMHLLFSRLAWFNPIANLWKLIISGLTGILLYLPAAIWIDTRFDDQSLPSGYIAVIHEAFAELAAIGPPILIGWLAMNLPWLLGFRFERTNSPEKVPDARRMNGPPATITIRPNQEEHDLPAFFPDDLKDIVLLKAELHYLLVVTTTSKSLELYNLRDAIKLLGKIEGITPHRSWWVNRQYIESCFVTGRQGKLVLADGMEIPVSRRKIPEVRETLSRWDITVRR